MKTIEQLRKEYIESHRLLEEDHCKGCQAVMYHDDCISSAFLAGATAVQEWIPCSRPPKNHKVVLLRLGGEMTEDQSWGIIPVTAYRENGKWFYALFGEEIEDWYVFEEWRPINY